MSRVTLPVSSQKAIVAQAAHAAGIDPAILWGVYGVETSFGTNVTNSGVGANGGAKGPFQFEDATARAYGLRNPQDFRQAAFAAARLLATGKGGGIPGMVRVYYGAADPNYISKVRSFSHQYGATPPASAQSPAAPTASTPAAGTLDDAMVSALLNASRIPLKGGFKASNLLASLVSALDSGQYSSTAATRSTGGPAAPSAPSSSGGGSGGTPAPSSGGSGGGSGGGSAGTVVPAAQLVHQGNYGFFPQGGKDYTYGVEPILAAKLNKLAIEQHLHITGVSGHRTPQHSVQVGGFPNDPHTRGMASDSPGVEGVSEATLNRYGLTRPFGGPAEADHIQLKPGTTPVPGIHILGLGGGAAPTFSGNVSHAIQQARAAVPGGDSPGAIVRAAAASKGLDPKVLWGIYGAESSFGKAKGAGESMPPNFGSTGRYPSYPQHGTSGNFRTDAFNAASDLHHDIYDLAGGNLEKGLQIYSGGGYGLSHVQQLNAQNPLPPGSPVNRTTAVKATKTDNAVSTSAATPGDAGFYGPKSDLSVYPHWSTGLPEFAAKLGVEAVHASGGRPTGVLDNIEHGLMSAAKGLPALHATHYLSDLANAQQHAAPSRPTPQQTAARRYVPGLSNIGPQHNAPAPPQHSGGFLSNIGHAIANAVAHTDPAHHAPRPAGARFTGPH